MIYGLLGNPINRSWSEVLFNRIFELEGSDHVYAAINADPHSIKRFMEKGVETFGGFNVTIPYKEEILRYVENRDPLVWKAGVANVLKKEGRGFMAFNTDYSGLDFLFTENHIDLNGKSIAIAGTGGVASILIYYILANSSPECLHIYSRNSEIASRKIRGTWQYENMKIRDYSENGIYDILINCTPLGMQHTDRSPFTQEFYEDKSIAVDLTYQNDHTNFMRIAEDHGGRSLNGRDMFFKQAQETYRIFFMDECRKDVFNQARGDTLRWMTGNSF
ncbi:MAG: shikimate dehydrogenase family protein [Cuniculiplasma sp.]